MESDTEASPGSMMLEFSQMLGDLKDKALTLARKKYRREESDSEGMQTSRP